LKRRSLMDCFKENAFECVAIPPFPSKPRDTGLTMVLEYGLGIPYQQGFIESAGRFVDMVKFATGVSRVLPRDVLKRKIALYIENGIHCFPGGQFFELAYLQKRAEAYLKEVRAVGFSHVEISENCIDLPAGEKADFIRRAADLGLTVLGESGKKLDASGAGDIIEDIRNCREAGAWKVFVEAAELIEDQALNLELVKALTRDVEVGYLIFEIPGAWMKGMSFSTQYGFWKVLIHHIGPDVNLANIPAEEVLRLSLMRLGLGADTSLEKGAFVMSERGLL
jgi:phosphosulfolactate synthase